VPSVNHAGWRFDYAVPDLANGGLVVSNARFHGRLVLVEGSQPFSLTVYHDITNVGDHLETVYKDGLGNGACSSGGSPYRAIVPSAPNGAADALEPRHYATNGGPWDPLSSPGGAVRVELHEPDLTEPARAVVWAKFEMHHYQFIHRWEFNAGGTIDVRVGLGGKLNDAVTDPRMLNHIHQFYFRLRFNLDALGDNAAQRFDHAGFIPGQDQWTDITHEQVEIGSPNGRTKWRVRSGSPKPNGRYRSYELIPGSDGAVDGEFSSGDLWVLNFDSAETGADVECDDSILSRSYVDPAATIDGSEIVFWHCLRHHHEARQFGEEQAVVPHEFIGFSLEPRDFLDDTLRRLYTTDPPSPIGPPPRPDPRGPDPS